MRYNDLIKKAQAKKLSDRFREAYVGGPVGSDKQNLFFGPNSKFLAATREATDPLLRAGPVAASKAVFDPILQAPANMLLGRKSRYGSYKGSRLRATPSSGRGVTGDYVPVDAETAKKIMSGELPGTVKRFSSNSKLGPKEVFMQRRATYGGLVGWAQRNPKLAAGSGVLAYLLATNPSLRGLAAGFLPGLPQNKIAPDVLREFSKQPSMEDPFAGGAWK